MGCRTFRITVSLAQALEFSGVAHLPIDVRCDDSRLVGYSKVGTTSIFFAVSELCAGFEGTHIRKNRQCESRRYNSFCANFRLARHPLISPQMPI